jgi:hypothetical protein
MNWRKNIILVASFCLVACIPVYVKAQDSLTVSPPTDSAKVVLVNAPTLAADTLLIKRSKHSPRKATLLSLALPGLGQAYNRKYWKMPLIYGGLGVLGYFIITNNDSYHEWGNAYVKILKNPGTPVPVGKYDKITDPNIYKRQRDTYRRNYEYSIILTAALWALNMLDANVDAHLKGFDLSDDISLRIKPGAPGIASPPAAGLTLALTWK